MAARLDAEEAHVDDLRDVDDTGPLLRRALDHVTPRESVGESVGENKSAATAGAATESADELDASDEPGGTGPETPTS
jgi:hypothetical protein